MTSSRAEQRLSAHALATASETKAADEGPNEDLIPGLSTSTANCPAQHAFAQVTLPGDLEESAAALAADEETTNDEDMATAGIADNEEAGRAGSHHLVRGVSLVSEHAGEPGSAQNDMLASPLNFEDEDDFGADDADQLCSPFLTGAELPVLTLASPPDLTPDKPSPPPASRQPHQSSSLPRRMAQAHEMPQPSSQGGSAMAMRPGLELQMGKACGAMAETQVDDDRSWVDALPGHVRQRYLTARATLGNSIDKPADVAGVGKGRGSGIVQKTVSGRAGAGNNRGSGMIENDASDRVLLKGKGLACPPLQPRLISRASAGCPNIDIQQASLAKHGASTGGSLTTDAAAAAAGGSSSGPETAGTSRLPPLGPLSTAASHSVATGTSSGAGPSSSSAGLGGTRRMPPTFGGPPATGRKKTRIISSSVGKSATTAKPASSAGPTSRPATTNPAGAPTSAINAKSAVVGCSAEAAQIVSEPTTVSEPIRPDDPRRTSHQQREPALLAASDKPRPIRSQHAASSSDLTAARPGALTLAGRAAADMKPGAAGMANAAIRALADWKGMSLQHMAQHLLELSQDQRDALRKAYADAHAVR